MNKRLMRRIELPLMLLFAALAQGSAFGTEDLFGTFENPRAEASPGVWWHWVGGIADSPADITADLDAMRAQGIGRVTLFEQTDRKVPQNAEWMALFGHAASEAKRLGLAFETHDSWHYNVSHGPWITPEKAQKVLTWSRVFVNGPTNSPVAIPQPPPAVDKPGYREFYRDIAVFAIRVADPISIAATMEAAQPKWSSSHDDGHAPTLDKPLVLDLAGGEGHVVCEFPTPYAAAGVFLVLGEQNAGVVHVEASEDGRLFQSHARREFEQKDRFLNKHWRYVVWNFDPKEARFFRLRFEQTGKGAVPLRLGRVEWLQKGEWPRSLPPVARPGLKTGDKHMWEDQFERNRVEAADAYSSVHETLPGGRAPADSIDLTNRMRKDGTLEWEIPAGAWIIYRLGYCAKKIHFDSCDKLDASGVELHFANYPAALINKAKEAGGAIADIFIDSWEVEGQNWAERLPEEFQKRRGYDMRPYLPVLVGEVVGSPEISNRFLWDYRRTLGDLMAENYFGRLRDLCHEQGVKFTAQAGPAISFKGYHDLMMDVLMQYGRADVPMGEFWNGPNPATDNPGRTPYENVCLRSAVSAAHLYGRPIVQAESFTGGGNFRAAPCSLKPSGDRAFCMGINRLVIHEYTAQSGEDNLKPGRSWVWGTDWQRNITWWEDSHHWLDYLRRCQSLLQQGQPVVDVCVFTGEGVPNFPGIELRQPPEPAPPPAYRLPPGFKQDWCNVEGLQTMRVENGEIVLPGGMRYRLLLLPEHGMLSPSVLKKLHELVRNGATIMGPKPVRSPGLTGYPDCDREVRELAGQLWGAIDGNAVRENKVGQGRVLWGYSLEEALGACGTKPDFTSVPAAGPPRELGYYHRRLANQDIYFVVNHSPEPFVGDALFRVEGGQPELWDPVSGRKRLPLLHGQESGQARVRLSLAPHAATFVVFQPSSTPGMRIEKIAEAGEPVADTKNVDAHFDPTNGGELSVAGLKPGSYQITLADGATVALEAPSAPEVEIAGPWEVRFPAESGAPPKANFETLVPWTQRTEDGIKYFSGTAEYRKEFEMAGDALPPGARWILDLGRVEQLAEIRLNGKPLGVVWTPPYAVDATEALRKGKNELVVEVTNVWFNRLRGDAEVPADQRIAKFTEPALFEQSFLNKVKNQPLVESGLLGPVRIRSVPVAAFSTPAGGKSAAKGTR